MTENLTTTATLNQLINNITSGNKAYLDSSKMGTGPAKGHKIVVVRQPAQHPVMNPPANKGQYILMKATSSPSEVTPQTGSTFIFTTADGQVQQVQAAGANIAQMFATPAPAPAVTQFEYVSGYQAPPASISNAASQYYAAAGIQVSTGGTLANPASQVAYNNGITTNFDIESQSFMHTTRASPVTVQWLVDNYETAEGVSLPRSTIYAHYLHHCNEEKLDPMNPASFGKLIRSVFLGLRTRRLGTRGNSKYHYYGIRIKPSSLLNGISEDMVMTEYHNFSSAAGITQSNSGPAPNSKKKSPSSTGVTSIPGGTGERTFGGPVNDAMLLNQSYLGDVSKVLPRFNEFFIHIQTGPEVPKAPGAKSPRRFVVSQDELDMLGLTELDVRTYEQLYREQCDTVVESVAQLQFTIIDQLWQFFWRSGNIPDDKEDCDEEEILEEERYESRLAKEALQNLCCIPGVREWTQAIDYAFFQSLVYVLIPDVLRPIPSSMTQSIRNFAKSLDGWIKSAMCDMPAEMVQVKVSVVTTFAQTLRRYTSLNHLAQAARAVLQNSSQLQQMLADLNRVDFLNIQEQAVWVCQCTDETVTRVEREFKSALSEQRSLDQWCGWLETVIDSVLPRQYPSFDELAKSAREFLVKWSFYSSLVIRDLTLRSAASFGSFHLIRLLFDEYMFFLLEHKVAKAARDVPLCILDQARQNNAPGKLPVPLHSLETESLMQQPCNPIVCAPPPLPVSSQQRNINGFRPPSGQDLMQTKRFPSELLLEPLDVKRQHLEDSSSLDNTG